MKESADTTTSACVDDCGIGFYVKVRGVNKTCTKCIDNCDDCTGVPINKCKKCTQSSAANDDSKYAIKYDRKADDSANEIFGSQCY